MATSLIMHKRINTTVAKAKALRQYVEPLITKAKDDTTHSRRVVFSYLQDKFAVTELFREISSKVGDRPGGYTRIIKLGKRLGDSADMAMIELVDYNENLLTEKTGKKAKTTRRRRGAKKKPAGEVMATTTAETQKEVKEARVEEPEAVQETETTEKVEEVKAEKPVKEDKAEKPAEETKAEKPVKEVKAEKPAEDIKAEKPAEQAKEKEPAKEIKVEKPVKEVKAEKPKPESGKKTEDKPEAKAKAKKEDTEEGTETEEKK